MITFKRRVLCYDCYLTDSDERRRRAHCKYIRLQARGTATATTIKLLLLRQELIYLCDSIGARGHYTICRLSNFRIIKFIYVKLNVFNYLNR